MENTGFLHSIQERLSGLNFDLLGDVLGYDPANPMLFNTGLFLLLFTVFIGLFQLTQRQRVVRMLLVIAFSLFFYWKSSGLLSCLILLGVCVSDFVLARFIASSTMKWERKFYVCINLVICVGMLVYFKYFNMLYESFASLTGGNYDPLENLLLPAGISFFAFRSISYIVDVYRGKLVPCDNLLDYIFFLTFFPPLLAGPVVRAVDMLPQIKLNTPATRTMVAQGIFLIICGLVKKVIIADYISGNFVSRIFENPSLYSGFENMMGAIGFTIQLYCDFSGYSDMAIGLALLMGFRFLDNFDAPFKSQNPTEFWRRWHISLSSWLRDYIYIPFGGNRKGKLRQYLNLFLTMLIGGLWHGASWMYVIWGAYNGVLLAVHKAIKNVWHIPERLKGTRLVTATNIFISTLLAVVGFMFFRATSLENVAVMFNQIFSDFRPQVIPAFVESYALITALIIGGFVMHYLPRRLTNRTLSVFTATPLVVQGLILAVAIFVIIQSRQADLVPFVYLRY